MRLDDVVVALVGGDERIDIHTGRPLGLADKHLLALYPQTALELAWNVTKGLFLCHIEVAVE